MTTPSTAPNGPSMRVRLTVAYDGRGFHGFAANEGVRTVAGVLIDALTTVLRLDAPLELACAGRTDRGVHALGQVVSFDVGARHRPGAARAPREPLGGAGGRRARPRSVSPRPSTPDPRPRRARTGTSSGTDPEPDPFRWGRAWHVAEPLELAALRLSCDPFIGSHDFAAFCRRATRRDGTPVTLRRRVLAASWHEVDPGVLHFEITASSFCHQMVRAVVGTMVEVGRGRRHAGELLDVIRSGDRAAAGVLAPPDGLFLLSVGYPIEMAPIA